MGARDHPGLNRLRQRTAWVLWAETLIIMLAPSVGILVLYAILAMLGLGNGWLFCLAILASAMLLANGWRNFQAPSPTRIEQRIEASSNLQHRPFVTLADQPENDDEGATDLWRAHQQRAVAALANATIPALTLNAAQRDKFALRALLTISLLASLIIAGTAAPGRISAAIILPNWPFGGPHVTAWVTPPSFTGAGPHVLAAGEEYTTITGSSLTIITDGPRHAPKPHFGKTAFAITNLSDTSHRADATITNSAALTIGPWWHRLGSWNIIAVAPASPIVQITEASIANTNLIHLLWHVTDPYGLKTLKVAFKPPGHPNAVAFAFNLPVANGDGGTFMDVTRSPFANEPVALTLTATNVAGATAAARAPQNFTLPGYPLHDATAIALAKIRQGIANDPASLPSSASVLKILSLAPPSAISDAADIKISTLATSVWLADTDVANTLSRLLALTLEIEAGPDFLPGQRFAASHEALMAALERGLHGTPPDANTLKQLLAAMEQAAAQHIAALQSAAGQSGKQINLSALDDLAQKIAADEAAGRTAQAAQELKLLQQILNALQNAHPMTAAQLARSQAANAAAQAIAQMTQSEAALLDATHAGNATPGAQSAVQNQLSGTQQSLAKAGLTLPGLNQANTAMQSAQQALTRNNTENAATSETTAIKNLQAAAAALTKAASQQLTLNPGSQPSGDNDQDNSDGAPDEQSNPNFDPDQTNPAAAIQQQIIQQDAKPAPTPTHDYYRKLLSPTP